MKTFAPAILALTAAVIALSASAQPAATPPPAPAKHHAACFWRRNIDNFSAANDTTVYLRAGVSDVYELKLFANCFDVDWVHRIALSSFGGFDPTICEGPNPGIDVIVRDIGIGRQRCPVTSVRKLTPAEVAALPKSVRP